MSWVSIITSGGTRVLKKGDYTPGYELSTSSNSASSEKSIRSLRCWALLLVDLVLLACLTAMLATLWEGPTSPSIPFLFLGLLPSI